MDERNNKHEDVSEAIEETLKKIDALKNGGDK